MKQFLSTYGLKRFARIIKQNIQTEITTLNNSISSALNTHTGNKSNPHSVTCSQIGAAVSGHNHDTVYSKTDHTHSGYASSSHNHDSTYAAKSHNHDDRYYTETEMNTKLAGKSDTTHTHSGYASTSHNHDSSYAAKSNVPFKFGVDSNGNYGYYKDGADTVTPFLRPLEFTTDAINTCTSVATGPYITNKLDTSSNDIYIYINKSNVSGVKAGVIYGYIVCRVDPNTSTKIELIIGTDVFLDDMEDDYITKFFNGKLGKYHVRFNTSLSLKVFYEVSIHSDKEHGILMLGTGIYLF